MGQLCANTPVGPNTPVNPDLPVGPDLPVKIKPFPEIPAATGTCQLLALLGSRPCGFQTKLNDNHSSSFLGQVP